MELPSKDEDAFSIVVRAKGQAAAIMQTTMTRTNETELKRQAIGKLPELLKIIHDEENRMKLIEGVVVG